MSLYRTRRLVPYLLLLSMAFIGSGTSYADFLRLTTEYLDPYNVPTADGRSATGIVGDKVSELMRRAGIDYTLEAVSWQRAYNLAQVQPDTCVFGTARITERETLFKWIGPLATTEWVIIGRYDSPPVRRLEDLKNTPIAGYRSDAVATHLANQQYKIVTATNGEVCLRNLLAGRIDYWAAGRLSSPQIIKRLQAQSQVKVLFSFNRQELYLACNLDVPIKVIDALQAAYKSMETDGTLRQIDQRYPSLP
ncbi:ABC transporter substrate-binding protein [Chitinivorax sp. B]|uniref:substrate-binding periplasmic protein n=1 Tax=Chitinivorax sp. B TaxID=2502235 RepID=UPI0014850BD7|nr:ABC transporter substrate-binding protein [Chitinivorax sp. B]